MVWFHRQCNTSMTIPFHPQDNDIAGLGSPQLAEDRTTNYTYKKIPEVVVWMTLWIYDTNSIQETSPLKIIPSHTFLPLVKYLSVNIPLCWGHPSEAVPFRKVHPLADFPNLPVTVTTFCPLSYADLYKYIICCELTWTRLLPSLWSNICPI